MQTNKPTPADCPRCPNYALDGDHPALDGLSDPDDLLDMCIRLCQSCPLG